MPFRIDYTDELSVNYPTSYWVIRYLALNEDGYGSILYQGWESEEDKEALGDDGIIGEHLFTVNDPERFELSFALAHAAQIRGVDTPVSYFSALENAMNTNIWDVFFNTDAVTLSYVTPVTIEAGSQGPQRVIVEFPSQVFPFHTGYEVGVTIKINGVAATISAASANVAEDTIYYDLVETIDADDVVTWEYAGDELRVTWEAILPHFTPIAVTNTVGTYLRFDEAENSGHIFLPLGA